MKIENIHGLKRVLGALVEAKRLGLENIVLERINGYLETCEICEGYTNCDGDIVYLANGFSFPASDINRIFTVGERTAEFQKPSPQNVKEKIIQHFEKNMGDIIFIVADDEEYSCLYRYELEGLGNLEKIRFDHQTVIFPTDRYFYVRNLKSINSVGKTLLN